MSYKILVIDDEEIIRFAFKNHLSKEGYKVIVAKDYPSALQAISDNNLDLIIADIILGSHTGIDILRKVKELKLTCPVVMITGEPNMTTALEALRLGSFDYIPKPFNKDKLLHVTQKALNYKRLLNEKERYRENIEAIFRSLKDAIISVDQQMIIIEMNEAVNSICMFSSKDAIGKRFDEIPTSCQKPCLKVLQDTLQQKKEIQEYRVECRHLHDQPGQIVLLTSSLLRHPSGETMGAILVIRDITRLLELECELENRQKFHNIIGKSQKMQEVFRLIRKLANITTSVLITGESGTGKELIARALHNESPRALEPFVAVNCPTISENLLVSELFGHVKGAFTGAIRDKQGRFEKADGGTILLDEIGDVSPRVQVMLLRVLQEKEFERVGDSRTIKVNVRIIAATNQDLKEKVKRGEFREDLYYRLKVVEIKLPPLRERRDDIPLLTNFICSQLNQKFKMQINGVTDDVMTCFMRYPWPGNIRELEHSLEHSYVLCDGKSIAIDNIPSEFREFGYFQSTDILNETIDEEQRLIQALKTTGWNMSKAARLLKISRSTIYRKIKDLNLKKPVDL